MDKLVISVSCKFLTIALFGYPLGQEYDQQNEASAAQCQEGYSKEKIPIPDVVWLADAEPLLAPGRSHLWISNSLRFLTVMV